MNSNATSFPGTIPEHYDSFLGPVLFADFAADLARRTAGLRPSCVLETAAGTGLVTRKLRGLLPEGAQLVATDLNPPMLEEARKKFGSAAEVTFQQADASALPFPDQSFDAVVCQFGVMFYPDKDKSFREAYRVLTNCGRYVFSVWDSWRYNRFARTAHTVIGSFFETDPPQFYAVPFSYYEIDLVKESLIAAGFSDLLIAVISLKKMIEDTVPFAKGLVYGNPVIDQIRARGGADPDHIVSELAKELRREFGESPCEIALQAIVCSAAKVY